MPRFYHEKACRIHYSLWISIFFFIVVIGMLWIGLYGVTKKNQEQQKKFLEEAIQRAIIQTYIYEGSYPESLESIKKDFKLKYNEEQFFVDYQVLGANIIPDVTVIEK